MKLQLQDTTLVAIDCINAHKAIKVLEHCKKMCDFGAVKLLTSIPVDYIHSEKIMPLNSLIAYSVFALTKLHEYIHTKTLLIVQCDGWILNPQSFDNSWLELDFIGGIFMQYNRVGSGGFSLRSKRLMQETAKQTPEWDGTQKGAELVQSQLSYYEDGEICLTDKYRGFKIATLEQAANFSQAGNRDPQYFREYPFGFHRTFSHIDFNTGKVDSSDLTKDIHVSYDFEIEQL